MIPEYMKLECEYKELNLKIFKRKNYIYNMMFEYMELSLNIWDKIQNIWNETWEYLKGKSEYIEWNLYWMKSDVIKVPSCVFSCVIVPYRCWTMSESSQNLVVTILLTLNACTGQNTGKCIQYCSTDEEINLLFLHGRLNVVNLTGQEVPAYQANINTERNMPSTSIYNVHSNHALVYQLPKVLFQSTSP